MTKCETCKKELGDNYKETKIFCNNNCLNAYLQSAIDNYIDSNVHQIVKDNLDLARDYMHD